MKPEIKKRLASVIAKMETVGGPRLVQRDTNKEKAEAIEEAALEGAIVILDKLHELLGVPASPEAKEMLASKIRAVLHS